MKSISRNEVLRWVSGPQSQGGSGGGGGSVDLAGYATQIWTEQNYVNKEFFSSLFKAYDANGNEVLPNDTETAIDNIKAMFGFWTEQYLSALGQGSGGGGGGASALSDLLDVQLTNPTNGQALIYNSTLCKWVNGSAGTDMASVWENLAGATTEQINVSHLTNALSGYVTTSAISDMATKSWVNLQGFATQTWVNQNFITIAFFDRLFQAYEGTGSSAVRVNPNNTTSTIDNVKAMFGFWTEQYISALGQGSGGGGGGVGDVTWDLLANNSDTRQIALSHLTTALSGYALTSQIPTNNNQLTNGAGYITSSALDGYASISLVDGRLSMNSDTNGNNVDFNAITYNASTGIVIQPIHVLNYSGCSNYPFNQYGTLVTFSGSTYFPFQLASCQGGALYYRADNYQPTSPFKFNNSTGWVRIIDSSNIGSQSVSYATSAGSATKLSTARTIWGQSFDGTANVSGNMTGVGTISASGDIGVTKSSGETNVFVSNNNGKIGLQTATNRGIWDFTRSRWLIATDGTNSWLNAGNVGIGTTSPYYNLHVAGTFYASGNSSIGGTLDVTNTATIGGDLTVNGGDLIVNEQDSSSASAIWFQSGGTTYGNLRVKPGNGEFYFYQGGTSSGQSSVWVNAGGFYAYGQVVSLSDVRDKNVMGDVSLNVEQIANAPAIRFMWKDGRDDKSMQAGSIAQYWYKVLPEVIREKDDRLSLSYGVAALVSSIITARKVVDHERRIAELERENKELKMKLKIA